MAFPVKNKRRRIYSAAFIALLLAIIYIAVRANYTGQGLNGSKPDVIIVLGSPATKQCTPTNILKTRIEKGVKLFKQGLAPRIIFTGGAVANQCVEAEVMKEYALSMGVPDSCILTEPQAQNTYQNAFYSVEIMKNLELHSAVIVTSKYHSNRAAHIFSNYEIDYEMSPCENPARSLKLYYWMVREFLIVCAHSIMGYPSGFGL